MATTTRRTKKSRQSGDSIPTTHPLLQQLGLADVAAWKTWATKLARRKKPTPLVDLIDIKKASPLAWSLPGEAVEGETADLMDRLARLGRREKPRRVESLAEEISPWLAEADGRPASPEYALECLAWCHALPKLAEAASPADWCALLAHLLEAVAQTAPLALHQTPLEHQLLAGELPLTLAWLFPKLPSCAELAEPGAAAISTGLLELLDGEGEIASQHLDQFRQLLGCWTRATLLTQKMKRVAISTEGQAQFDWAVRQGMRLTRADGSQTLSAVPSLRQGELFQTALRLCNDPTDWTIADVAMRGVRVPPSTLMAIDDVEAAPTRSEWAGVALLRSDWTRKATRLTVAYHEAHCRTELEVGGRLLWSGPLDAEVSLDGQTIPATGDWEETCWFVDDEVSYIEMSLELAGDWRIERHLLLAHRERMVLFADVVAGPEPGELEYCCRLPVASEMTFAPADESREGHLFPAGKSRPVAVVLPLALPEWRIDRRLGELEMTPQGLQLRQTARQERMMAPVLIDLHPGRIRRPLTWRQLTVAEKLVIQPSNVAVGYRAQVGLRQWMIYRTLAERGNRTVLGQNFSNEFYVGRFRGSGNVEPLLVVE